MGELFDILKQTGAVITNDHFVLASGRHSGTSFGRTHDEPDGRGDGA